MTSNIIWIILCLVNCVVFARAHVSLFDQEEMNGSRLSFADKVSVRNIVEQSLLDLIKRPDIKKAIISSLGDKLCLCEHLDKVHKLNIDNDLIGNNTIGEKPSKGISKSHVRVRRRAESSDRRSKLKEINSGLKRMNNRFGAISEALQSHWDTIKAQRETLLRHTELHEHHKDRARELQDDMSIVHAHMSRVTADLRRKMHEMDAVKNASNVLEQSLSAHAQSVSELSNNHRILSENLDRLREEQVDKENQLNQIERRSSILEKSLQRWLKFQRHLSPNETSASSHLGWLQDKLPHAATDADLWTEIMFLPSLVHSLNRTLQSLQTRGFTHQEQIDMLAADQESVKDNVHAIMIGLQNTQYRLASASAMNLTIKKILELEDRMAILAEAMLSFHEQTTDPHYLHISQSLVRTATNDSDWNDWIEYFSELDEILQRIEDSNSAARERNDKGTVVRNNHGNRTQGRSNPPEDGFLVSALPTGSNPGGLEREHKPAEASTSHSVNISNGFSTPTPNPGFPPFTTAHNPTHNRSKVVSSDIDDREQVASGVITPVGRTVDVSSTTANTFEAATTSRSPVDGGRTLVYPNTKDQNACRMTVLEISEDFHIVANLTGYIFGTWMRDALAKNDSVYILKKGKKVNNMRLYADIKALLAGNETTMFHMPFRCTGTGHVIFNGSIYCHKYMTNRIVKYSLETGELVSIRMRQAGFNNTFSYSIGLHTDMDFAVDEYGLWLVFSEEGNINLAKLDPNTLEVKNDWKVDFNKSRALNTFMVCGRLYVVIKNDTWQIAYVFDTHTGQSLDPDNAHLPFNNHFISMLDYNPKDMKLYVWQVSDWRQQLVLYDVQMISH